MKTDLDRDTHTRTHIHIQTHAHIVQKLTDGAQLFVAEEE